MKKAAIMALMVLAVSTSAAFDGSRKGFVCRYGLGLAPYAHWSTGSGYDYFGSTSSGETATGLGFNVVLGHGLDEKNVIAFMYNGSWYNSEFFSDVGRYVTDFEGNPHGSQDIVQAYMGPVWYHYFGEAAKTFFTAAGAGLYTLSKTSLGSNDPGLGAVIGGGYEFSKNFSVASYLSLGQSYDNSSYSFSHFQFSILLEMMWF